jgi:hypothetical protein
MYGLKPVLFKEQSFSAACEVQLPLLKQVAPTKLGAAYPPVLTQTLKAPGML